MDASFPTQWAALNQSNRAVQCR